MPITLGSNIASLASQRRLAEGTARLSKSYERLSSGLRINKASDDAAGLAIADSLRAQTRISQTAIRNSNDAISVVNIISSALDSQKGILTRMAELAEQAANGTYTFPQRKALDTEYRSLMAEFDRIAATTKFNGRDLLRSEEGEDVIFQVGITGEANALLSVQRANSHSLSGTIGLRSDYSDNNGSMVQATDLAYAYANGWTSTLENVYLHTEQIVSLFDSQGKEREIAILLFSYNNDAGSTAANRPAITQINHAIVELLNDGTVGGQVGSGGGTPVLLSSNNFTYTDTLTFADTGATASLTMNFGDLDFEHYDTLETVYSVTNNYKTILSSPVEETAIGFTNIRYRNQAARALDVINNRMNELSLLQSNYGAIQSRLQTATSNLTVSSENVAAAESRIRDADIATESAELVRLNILQQASAAVLAQANQQPSLALSLLGGV